MSEDAATIGMCWMEQYKVFEVDIHPTLKYLRSVDFWDNRNRVAKCWNLH